MLREIRKAGIPLDLDWPLTFTSLPNGVRFVGFGDPIEYSDKTHTAFYRG